jgi:predicted ATPase
MGERSVIVGSAGTGKTATVDFLRTYPGNWVSEESARAIIHGEKGKAALDLWNSLKKVETDPELHRKARLAWEEAILNSDITAFTNAPAKDHHCLFDCGVGEILAYLKMENIKAPLIFIDAVEKYKYDYVFIAPVWPELFKNASKPGALELANRYESTIRDVYETTGAKIITLPRKSPAARAAFIMETLLKGGL